MEVPPAKASSLGSYRTVTVIRAHVIVEFREGDRGLVCVFVEGSSYISKSVSKLYKNVNVIYLDFHSINTQCFGWFG